MKAIEGSPISILAGLPLGRRAGVSPHFLHFSIRDLKPPSTHFMPFPAPPGTKPDPPSVLIRVLLGPPRSRPRRWSAPATHQICQVCPPSAATPPCLRLLCYFVPKSPPPSLPPFGGKLIKRPNFMIISTILRFCTPPPQNRPPLPASFVSTNPQNQRRLSPSGPMECGLTNPARAGRQQR